MSSRQQTVQTMQAGNKHRDLRAEGDALQHVAVESDELSESSKDRLAGEEQSSEISLLTG